MSTVSVHGTMVVFLSHILVLALMLGDGRAQFAPCPANATSCCQCVTTPGCSWYYGPMDSMTERMPRCRPIALVAERPESYSRHFLTPPGLVNILDVPRRLDRPINPQRMRLLKPQTARVTIGLGMRRVVPIQVLAQTRRIRLKVVGPTDAPEFTLQRGDQLSCVHRFRVRERRSSGGGAQRNNTTSGTRTRSRGNSGQTPRTRTARSPGARNRRRQRGGGNRRQGGEGGGGGRGSRRNPTKQLHVDCYVSAPGDVQNLNLVVDMNRCYTGKKTIRIMLRQRGIKRSKVEIKSACSCPCQGDDGQALPGQDGQCEADQTEQTCDSVAQHGAGNSECSGVNNYCQRQEDEPVCSGHGICICAVCICNVLPNQSHPLIMPNGSQPIQQRYQGWYCQCDNTACSWSHGAMCGGSDRGVCECGACQCRGDYRGAACERTTAEENCVAPSSGTLCNNRGRCVEGACVCEHPFSGALCEVCHSCAPNCTTFRPCAECLFYPEHSNSGVQQNNCDSLCAVPNGNTTVSDLTTDEWPETCEVCMFSAHGCSHAYGYATDTTDGELRVTLYYRSQADCSDEHGDM